MAPTALKNAVVMTNDGTLDPSMFMGEVVSYRMTDEPKPVIDFLRAWSDNGLDTDDLPEARQPYHVFQSACASVRSKARAGEEKVEVRADELENDRVVCSYQVTLALWDLNAREIEHEKAMRVEFDKGSGAITVAKLANYDGRMVELERLIREHYDANGGMIPGPKIRNAVREQLLRVGAQNLRGKTGGVYFVPNKPPGGKRANSEVIDGLVGVLATLYGDAADWLRLPLVNDETRREMIARHFTINVTERAREAAEKAINRVRQGKGRGVREELVRNLRDEQRRILTDARHFKSIVGDELTDLTETMDELSTALDSLEDLAGL